MEIHYKSQQSKKTYLSFGDFLMMALMSIFWEDTTELRCRLLRRRAIQTEAVQLFINYGANVNATGGHMEGSRKQLNQIYRITEISIGHEDKGR